MRNTGVQFILDLLYRHVSYDGSFVPIIKRAYPIDKTPCITIDNQNNTLKFTYYSHNPYEWFRKRYEATTVIDVWCNSEDERQTILEQVDDCFNGVLNYYYPFCSRYHSGQCETLATDCPAPTSTRGRACKHQCPYPDEYNYENLTTKHNVDLESINVNQGVDADEYDKHDVLLRTSISVSFNYIVSVYNGGKVSTNLEYEEKEGG